MAPRSKAQRMARLRMIRFGAMEKSQAYEL